MKKKANDLKTISIDDIMKYQEQGGQVMSDKFDTKLDQLKGSVKEGFGKLTGDKKTETDGDRRCN